MDYTNCLHIEEKDFEPWAFQQVETYESIPNLSYWQDTGEVSMEHVALNKIAGTSHATYGGEGKTWADALVNLKHYSYEESEILLDRICSAEPVPTVGRFGDEYYIFDGNNRLCKARFLKLSTFFCRVKEYVFNFYDYSTSTLLKRQGFTFRYVPGSVKKFDHITYKKKLFLLSDDVTIGDFVNYIITIRYSIWDHIIYSLSGKSHVRQGAFIVKKGKKGMRCLKKELFHWGFRADF